MLRGEGNGLAEAIASSGILVVCGSGGVGKTSVSAALALAAAQDRKTIVLTIDPARRLASALGLGTGLGHHEVEVEIGSAGGSLTAAMLDMKSAWDELVDRYSPDAEVARHLKSNRLYQGLSEHFVGSQGYMAMERLADLHDRGVYDLIVIDTPPTRHALDFLDAPKRMTDLVGGNVLKWLARPYSAAGRVGLRAFNVTATPFLKIADRVLGSQLLEDLSAFVVDFQSLYDAFKERAAEVLQIMQQPTTGFVVVTTLEGPPLGEAGFFIDRLVDEGLRLAGVVANKTIPARFAEPDARETLEALDVADVQTVARPLGLDEDATRAVLSEGAETLRTLHDLATRDLRRAEELSKRARTRVISVPLLTQDVHDLGSLRELGDHLL
ncbi:MAG TPA: ArsA-related P-loop ATPase [Actinomycetota bacterium]|nr:ArsA-related P-loop ATPase [Actinomycetota bacterium]